MSEIAIRVENVGKEYRIGALQPNGRRYSYKSLRDSVAAAAARPFRAMRASAHPEGNVQPPSDETFWALRDVSFEVKRGEVLGVIGRNGAGKSTLLKVLARITPPTTGIAAIHGRVGSLLEVGTGFHPELTGRENIYLNGAILGMRRAEIYRHFDAIVSFAEVDKFIDTPVKHYSSGMYLRLAFAVAAHLQTEILFIDEVLAVGDVVFQKKCLGKLGQLAGEGRTVLFVSHSMNAIEHFCTRVICLSDGQIKNDGSPASAIAEYLRASSTGNLMPYWLNRGNEFENANCKPIRFYLSQSNGEYLSSPLSADEEIWVTVEAVIAKVDPALFVGYSVFVKDGLLLYASHNIDEQESCWPRLKVGHCLLRSRIPPRLLNKGNYRLELIVGLYFREWISRPGLNSPAIHFEVRSGGSDSPYWNGTDGIIAPIFPWESVQLRGHSE